MIWINWIKIFIIFSVFVSGKLCACIHTHTYILEKEMANHSSVLAWRIPGMGEPGGLLSMGSHRVGHDWSDLAIAIYIYIFLGKYPRQVWSLKHHYMFIEYESLCSYPWLINQKHLLIFFPWLTDNKISKMARRRSYKILCIWFLDIDPFYKEKANSLPFFPWWVKYFWSTT